MGNPKYPKMAGWRGNKQTGIKSAFEVSKDLGRRHAEVLAAFMEQGASGATCDLIADSLGLSVFHVRPRASELERLGKLWPIGSAMGGYGRPVTVYSATKPESGAQS